MPCSAVVLVLLRDRNDGGEHGMRKTRVFGQLLGVQGMVIGEVTVQADPDGDGEILVVSGPGGGGRWTPVPLAPSWSPRRRGCSARTTVCWWRTCPGPGPARNAPTCWRTPARGWPRTWH